MPRRTGDALFRAYAEPPPPSAHATLETLAAHVQSQLRDEA